MYDFSYTLKYSMVCEEFREIYKTIKVEGTTLTSKQMKFYFNLRVRLLMFSHVRLNVYIPLPALISGITVVRLLKLD